jgi:hypothetical protein
MANDKDTSALWGAELDGKDAPVDGIDRAAVQRVLDLNPEMQKRLGSTSDIIKSLETASAARPVGGSTETEAPRQTMNLVEGMEHHKQRYQTESKRLAEELKRVQTQIQQLAPTTLERVIELFLQHDPNMNTAFTQEILKMEGQFLQSIGFSIRKVIEKQMKKR